MTTEMNKTGYTINYVDCVTFAHQQITFLCTACFWLRKQKYMSRPIVKHKNVGILSYYRNDSFVEI